MVVWGIVFIIMLHESWKYAEGKTIQCWKIEDTLASEMIVIKSFFKKNL